MNFNAILKTTPYKAKSNWRKYGITLKIDGKYFYMSAIPYDKSFQNFETITISEGISARFIHMGSMEKIKTTVHTIYKLIVPEKQLQLDSERKILHYELYDNRFHWNKDNSIIEIYLPLLDYQMIK